LNIGNFDFELVRHSPDEVSDRRWERDPGLEQLGSPSVSGVQGEDFDFLSSSGEEAQSSRLPASNLHSCCVTMGKCAVDLPVASSFFVGFDIRELVRCCSSKNLTLRSSSAHDCGLVTP